MKSREKYARSYPMVTDGMNIQIRGSKGTKGNSRDFFLVWGDKGEAGWGRTSLQGRLPG